MTKIAINNVIRDMTAEEQAAFDARNTAWNNAKVDRKLEQIKKIRNKKLQETDYMANSDYTMPSYIKTWRQSLRDIPPNHTDEDAYDLLLARGSDKKLTHAIWTQPTE